MRETVWAALLILWAPAAWAQSQKKPGPRPLTPQEGEVLKEIERDAERYQDASGDHMQQLRGVLRREYHDKVRAIGDRYQQALDSADKDYRARSLSALEALQKFLIKYPNDPKWTPDAMFRLADLHLDKAKWEWDEKEAAAGNVPPPAPDPDAPPQYVGPDYTPSIEIWKQIAVRFPKFRQVDGSVYLMAYYQQEMRLTPEAKQAFLGLVCRNKYDPLATPPPPPDPRDLRRRLAAASRTTVDPYQGCEPMTRNTDLVDEGWVRLGELDFDTPGLLPTAIAAYKKVARNPKSKFYDIALYKLAWSYYRNNQFMDGIQAFDELVAYSDRLEAEGQPKNDLRGESVQYLAISFTDPWEDNTLSDPVKAMERLNAFYKGRQKERHVRDVYEQVGDVLRLSAGTPQPGEVPPEIRTAYREAIVAWRFTLDNYPTHPRNPIVHQKIVDALAFMGDAQAAGDERAKLATSYKRGTPWYEANETNPEAMENATRLTEGSLIEAARNMHRSAQLAKQGYQNTPSPEAKKAYINLYAQAAQLYQAYLQEFPGSSDAYEVTYRLADCLYFSEQYLASVVPYRWVRDHQELGTKYHDDAADSVVKAYEEAVSQAKAKGEVREPPVPTAEQLVKGAGKPQPIPPLYKDLQTAYDEYARLVPNDKSASTKALAAAMISYRHQQLDDALTRFETILGTFCKSSDAVQAKEGMLAIYQSRGQTDKFQSTADRFIKDACGSTPQDVLIAQKQKLSNEYAIAVNAYKDEKYDEAGQRFYGLYKGGTEGFEDRAGALFNAALAYNKAGKPKTAVALYQEFTKVPAFAKSEYYVEALYRTAESYQAAFDYEGAVDTYLRVVDEAGRPGRTSRPEFNLQDARVNALYNAALLRDLDRVYYDRGRNDPGAATLYKRYAALDVQNRERSRDAYFNAALVYEKAGNTKDMIKTFDEWKRKYGKDPGAGFKLVLAQHKTAKAMEKARDRDAAEKYYRATIRAYDDSGEKAGSPAAELAAEAQFWLAEQRYKNEFEKYKVRWLGNIADRNQKRAESAVLRTIEELQKVSKGTSSGYEAVARYEASWSLGAIVRLGDIAFFAGQKLVDAPVPAEIQRLDKAYPDQNVLGTYQETVETQVAPNTELAKKQWLRAVETAKNAGVANEWSKLAQQRLNSFIAADQYPVLRDELIEKEQNP